jgi:hypothetical protein
VAPRVELARNLGCQLLPELRLTRRGIDHWWLNHDAQPPDG